MKPKPTWVRYNDWRQVQAGPLDSFEPLLPVSVVIPYYQTPVETEKTLAALERQAYPRELFEVVVADDGSEPPFQPGAGCPLQVRVARQRHRGFGLARARNLGAKAAAHDILLFLDSDMLPEADWIAAHARWHHLLSDALTVCPRTKVSTDDVSADAIRDRTGSLADLFGNRPATACWTEEHLLRTGDLTSKDDAPFSAVVGANFGIRKEYYNAIGGTDESFCRWGLEDTEMGYRAFAHGGLVVPLRDTATWHQGLNEHRRAKMRARAINHGKGAHRIAHPWYRSAVAGRFFSVPRHVVTLDARPLRADQVVRTVAKLLADRVHDLVVRVEIEPDDDDRAQCVRNEFGPDPRVRVSPLRSVFEEFPASAFHIELPGSVVFARNIVHRLKAHLGDAVEMSAPLPGGSAVTVTRVWALHRARRTGAEPAAFGDSRSISASRLGVRPVALDASSAEIAASTIVPYATARRAPLRKALHIRTLADATRLLRKMFRGGGGQLTGRRSHR